MSVADIEQTRQQLERSLQMHRALSDILRISLEPLDLVRVLERALQVVLSLPWLAIERSRRWRLNEDYSALYSNIPLIDVRDRTGGLT